ncbi:oxygenase MpaB family protein [Nocardioides jejuensis]|uniref:DUF2236 domain-containing protein n=1 Tax=Nocardioides jejuensis TaxID=2502782 RepID=A0A4R1BXU8_9ACTN|nr:oxygenase MpaB family protein [Nocardioides jejuensis]TCJ22863.1 DUF2236 domain-containing protein [Nocardioides jejuensis]
MTTTLAPDLQARVDTLTALAATPGAEVYVPADELDLEAWNHVGDPLCEALITLMRERKLMGGDLYANARRLETEGVAEAVAFFKDVETIPSWLDFDALHLGATMARRNPIGMIFGMHGGLPYTYIDPSTAEVMGATGRFARGGDYERRFWETATGFVGALDVEGMKPGGERWIQWVRIRFLHTMIRLGIHRSGRWARGDVATPISQVASAGTAHIFGYYRVNIIRYFGGPVSDAEADSFNLMWRWVARIEGSNNQLLGRTREEQYALQAANHEFLYGKSTKAATLTADLIRGSASMKAFPLSARMHAAVVRNIMQPKMLELLPLHDVPTDLGVKRDLRSQALISVLAFVLRNVHQVIRIPLVRSLYDRYSMRILEGVVNKGLGGVKPEYRGTPVAGTPTDEGARPAA